MKLNKKQKRTATIASMAALLAVVLGMGGQTFAKYIETTSVKATQVTVAKWGVVIRATGDGTDRKSAFAKTYDSVASSTNEVVAPGTGGTLTFEITGSPEVKTGVKFSFTDYTEIHMENYYPIKWTLSVDDTTAVSYDRVATVEGVEGLADAVSKIKAEFTENTSVSKKVVITWKWEYGSADSDKGNDVNDTKLGDYAAYKAGSLSEAEYTKKYTSLPTTAAHQLEYNITATAYQID